MTVTSKPAPIPRRHHAHATLRPAAAALLAALPAPVPLSAQDDSAPIRVESIARTGDEVSLSWTGGASPFQVEWSEDFKTWEPAGDPVSGRSATLAASEPAAFFRVRSGDPVATGELLGQLRVAEGEFGKPLAKHRLKSVWDVHLPVGGTTAATPAGFFDELVVRLRFLDAAGTEVLGITGRFADLPGARITAEGTDVTVAWSHGTGDATRDFNLVLDFPYDVGTPRAPDDIHLSDPRYTLTCRYATAVPELGFDGVTRTRVDEVDLVEVAEDPTPPSWWHRRVEFDQAGVSIDSRFTIGVPMVQGRPAFIFKTPLLVQWDRTVVTGLTTEPIELRGRFSQTYYPSHHNFVETLYLDPALEPGISPRTLEELREANIRFIIPQNPSAFPEQKPTIRVMGFDDTLRDL